ncbi:MAG: carbon-nitrogen hydrolase family protein [Gammaproteobacteria bacterium]|nr:carbon-nitrogen hydrolase family protein [Gammaproteobacteria bacterium]MBK7171068.1 carbon-nitrogen hydrolase family protein [Gammaproteobacteria bacterium]
MSSARVAALQMISGGNVAGNLQVAEALIADAAGRGASLLVLPEAFACYDSEQSAALGAAERFADGPLRCFLAAQARRHRVFLVGGTIPITGADALPRAACLLYGPDGAELARYDKLHLFDVDLPDAQRCYRESAFYAPGAEVVSALTPCGLLGLAVCYDLRFPEMFRVLFQRGADVLALPSAFTRMTGEAHWHVLLRARAIENQAFVIAAAQGGRHSAQRETWGGSAIIDPWGRVLASAASGVQVICADLDPGVLEEVRARLPVRSHQRIYVPDPGTNDSSSKR